MTHKGYIRINFRLPQKLAIRFEQVVAKTGLPKSQLLREWLRKFDPESLPIADTSTDWTTFNLRFSLSEYSLLVSSSRKAHMRKGEYLRCLITHALKLSGANFQTVPSSTQPKNPLHLLQLADQQIEIGKLPQADSTLDELEENLVSKYREHHIFAQLDLRRGIIARHYRELDRAKRLFAHTHHILDDKSVHKLQLADLLDQQSVVAELEDDIDSAITKVKKMSLINPGASRRIHIRLANLYSMNGDSIASLDHLQQAQAEESNLNQLIRSMNREALVWIRTGDFVRAESLLHKVIITSSQQGFSKELRYGLENMSLVLIERQDFEGAIQLLEKAVSMDRDFRKRSDVYSKAEMLLLFCLAARGSESALGKLQDLVNLQHRPIYKALGEYYALAAKLLFDANLSSNTSVVKKLTELHLKRGPGLVRLAAGHLVHYGKLTPIL